MLRVHWFDWVDCVWRWAWRPAAVVRAMRHLTAAMIPAVCAGGILVPSPTAESVPAPPVGGVWAPPPAPWPPAPEEWPALPSPFGWAPGAPESDSRIDIVVPSVDQSADLGVDVPPEAVVPSADVPAVPSVSEPAALGWFVAATALLLSLRANSAPWGVLTGPPSA